LFSIRSVGKNEEFRVTPLAQPESSPLSNSAPPSARSLRSLLGNQQIVLFLVYLAMVAFFTWRNHIFFSTAVFGNILADFGPIALIAAGQMYVIVSGGIDLSVGYNLGFCGVVSALAMRNLTTHGWGANATLVLGVLVAVATGTCVGLINAFLINRAKLVPFISTLITLGACAGLSIVFTGGGPVGGGPSNAIRLTVPFLGPLSRPVLVVLVVVSIAGLFLHLSRFGRYTFAIGSNSFAARGAGINVTRHITKVYALSGFLAGLAGFYFYMRLGAGAPSTGAGNELDAIAAVVIGGAALTGGFGRMAGTMLGVLMITTVTSGLIIIGIAPNWKRVVVAILIAIAATVQSLRKSEGRTA
jgi:ribose transport system permease protein